MTETTQPDPQVVACPQCAAPAGAPCRTSGVGHARRPHESREVAVLRLTQDGAAETTQPDPQVVAWMRDRMNEEPYGMTAKDVRAYREANGLSAEDMLAAYEVVSRKIEVREDAAGTDSLIEAVTRKLDSEDVPLRGEEWRAAIDSPYSLILRQWAGSGERDEPTGPKVRVTFTVHVEEQP